MQPTRDSLQTQRHTQTESKGMERIFHATNREKKAGVAVLVSDKIDFKTKESHKRQRRTLHDKRVSATRGYNCYKYLCTQQRSTYIYETNTNRIKRGNRMQCIHSRRLQYFTHSKGQINQTENK